MRIVRSLKTSTSASQRSCTVWYKLRPSIAWKRRRFVRSIACTHLTRFWYSTRTFRMMVMFLVAIWLQMRSWMPQPRKCKVLSVMSMNRITSRSLSEIEQPSIKFFSSQRRRALQRYTKRCPKNISNASTSAKWNKLRNPSSNNSTSKLSRQYWRLPTQKTLSGKSLKAKWK